MDSKKIKKSFLIALGVVFFVGLLIFGEIRQQNLHCKAIVVKLDESAEYPFFDKADIMNAATSNGADPIVGMLCRKIDLRYIENIVQRNRLIRKCECSVDFEGNLVVAIKQETPIARFFSINSDSLSSLYKGSYITESGKVAPLSAHFAARVPLISGKFFRNLKNLQTEKGKNLVTLLNDIRQKPFWKAQITEMNVDDDGEITMWSQVGSHVIDFGLPTDTEAKFQKIKVFYNTILPLKGWQKYKRVSVKFKNQIVCV